MSAFVAPSGVLPPSGLSSPARSEYLRTQAHSVLRKTAGCWGLGAPLAAAQPCAGASRPVSSGVAGTATLAAERSARPSCGAALRATVCMGGGLGWRFAA